MKSNFNEWNDIGGHKSAAYNWRFTFGATSWWRNGGNTPAEKAVRN